VIDIATLWTAWSTPVGAILGGIGGALGTVLRYRTQSRRNQLDAGQQALVLVQASQKQQVQMAAAYERSIAFEMSARAREVATADLLQDVHAEAIAARLHCHDLEMRYNLPLTDFPLFPAFPWRVAPETASIDKPETTGAVAASTAKPGADNTHE